MNNFRKPPTYQAAFSLLELIVVVIILAIISGYTLSKFTSSSSYKKDAIVEQIISAARMTQQLSMNDSSRSFSLSIQNNQIDLLADGVSLSAAGLGFPIVFSSNVSLSPVSSIVFDNWGGTAGTTISVQLDTTINICFESSGYIHRC